MALPRIVTTESPLKVGVIGCGRMGRLHARAYSQMSQVKVTGVYDALPTSARMVADEFGLPAIEQLDRLLENVEAVTIAAPTIYHLPLAQKCLERRVACLIEKPLAKDAAEAKQIVQLAEKHNTCVQVGHIERFNPAVRAMAALNLRPKFLEVVRISPLTFRSIDVGVVLDMMIHDIDIVLWLADSTVREVSAVGVSVIGGVEDVCNARLNFANGCVANLTASRLAMSTERRLRVFSPDAYVSIDYQKRQGTMVRRAGNVEAIRSAVKQIREGQDGSRFDYKTLVNVEPLATDEADPLRSELEAFVNAASSGTKPIVTAEAGMQAVEIAERIVGAIGSTTLA